jgi:hypothetical protein
MDDLVDVLLGRRARPAWQTWKMIFDGVLWISEIVDNQTFASDSLDMTGCTWFDCPERSGKTYPGTMSPTSPRARFEIIDNRAGVGAPEDSTSPSAWNGWEEQADRFAPAGTALSCSNHRRL